MHGPLVAAIDVGSSATRLVVCQHGSTGPAVVFRQRIPLRLGTEVFACKKIGPESANLLVLAFEGIAKKLAALNVAAYRAVATSALRDALNGHDVLKNIRARTGMRVSIITGDQEADLMRRSLMAAVRRWHLPAPPADALLLDLGGGSLELMRADGSGTQSLPLGTVRLLGHYVQLAKPMSVMEAVHLSEAVVADLRKRVGQVDAALLALGTGGNIEAMAKGLAADPWGIVPSIDATALLPAACYLAPLPLNERATSFGLAPGRADLVLPALLMVHAVAQVFDVRTFWVPGGGIRDALIEDLLAQLTAGL